MAGVKFFMKFQNAQGDNCSVNFIYENYNDAPIEIFGGAQPFVLGEYNTEDDIFKPMRPQQATIQVLASAGGVSLEDFLTDDDEDVTVRFDFGSFGGYWYGYLSLEDIEEIWVSTNHILVLRADEGFGRMKQTQLTDDAGNQLAGTYDFFNLIQYSMNDVVGTFFQSRIYSNIFNTTMSIAANQTGIDQCTANVRTFETAPNEFEDNFSILEKINKAWCQTVFQWNSQWIILRIPELFTTGNLIGFNTNRPTVGNRAAVNKRYDIEVGVAENVKPIAPEMLKTVIKPSKETTTVFKYEYPPEILCNQSFEDGTQLTETSTTKTFSVNDWTRYKTSKETPTPSTAVWYRNYIFDTANEIYDNYLLVQPDLVDSWVQSCDVEVQAGDKLNIGFEFRRGGLFAGTAKVMQVLFKRERSLQYRYGLNDDGEWVLATTTWDSANVPYLTITFDSAAIDPQWQTYNVQSEPAPYAGKFRVLLYHDTSGVDIDFHYKNIEITIKPLKNGGYDPAITGEFDRYTIERNVRKNSEEQIFFDDTASAIQNGTIFELNGVDKTPEEWFRRTDFNGDVATDERYSFKRQHALAKWFMNRSYKTKLDVNFFGLKWKDISDVEYPIGIINTIKFVDDAPTKIFAIANLKEIDFMNCTWSASIVEIFDTSIADNEPGATDVHTFDYYYE